MHRRNALHCLTGVQRLGEKTQMWCQRLIYAMREQYSDIDIQRELDDLQERLDRQKELLKRRLSRQESKEQAEQAEQTKKKYPEAPDPSEEVW
jgi:hypothetical protein